MAVPSQARQAAEVGFVMAFTCQVQPEPPRMEALDRYIASPLFPFPDNNDDLSDLDLPVEVLAYKKAAKKVHPVAASLPEDFRIIRQRPEDPLLSLPALPTHPPQFTPGTRLTQEHFDELCYVSTRRLPDLGERVLRISLVRTTSAYFKQRQASKQ